MKTRVAIACGVVLITIAAFVFIGILLHLQPKRPGVNINDLIPTRVEVPAQSNGFDLLLKAGGLLAVGKSEPILMNETNWDEAGAKALVASNEAAMVVMRQAWSYPSLQVEAITNLAQDFSYLTDWRRLAQLAIVQARLSFNSGNEAQGFAQAMDVVRFGQRIQAADGAYLHYLVGTAIKSLGLQYIRQFANTTTLSTSNLITISEQLTNFEASQDALRQTLKIEYVTNAKMFDEITNMAATNGTYYVHFVFNAGQSKLELANQTFCTIKALTNSYATGIAFIPVAKPNTLFVRGLLNGNMMGTMLNEMSLDTRGHLLAGKCRENVSVRATRVILALRAFQIANHRPAKSLQELVPDFLETVALDDFDGKPLRYSPNLKEVYSVGTGLVDLGGLKSTNSPNTIFSFSF